LLTLGSTRTCDLLCSQSFSFRDTGRHRGTQEDKSALLCRFGPPGQTGRYRERHPVAVRIAVKICARKRNFPGGIERVLEREGLGIRSRPCFHIAKRSPRLQDSDPAKYLCLLIGGGCLRESENSLPLPNIDTLILTRVLTQKCKREPAVWKWVRGEYQKRTSMLKNAIIDDFDP
jgi:hypothetical protein